jgi:hypothetical protein
MMMIMMAALLVLSWNPKVHYFVHKNPEPNPKPDKFNSHPSKLFSQDSFNINLQKNLSMV